MARAMATRFAQDMSSSPAGNGSLATPRQSGTAAVGSQPVAMRVTVNIGKTELELLRTANQVPIPAV